MDDEELDCNEDLMEQARSRLARTSKYLPDNLSGAPEKVIRGARRALMRKISFRRLVEALPPFEQARFPSSYAGTPS